MRCCPPLPLSLIEGFEWDGLDVDGWNEMTLDEWFGMIADSTGAVRLEWNDLEINEWNDMTVEDWFGKIIF